MDPKLTPDVEAALAERMADVNELGDQMTREERGEFRKGFAAALALRGEGEFAHWHLNDDGSSSPPEDREAKVEPVLETVGGSYLQTEVLRWDWSCSARGKWACGQECSFEEAARELLKALEAQRGEGE